jgi:hypothetical protein
MPAAASVAEAPRSASAMVMAEGAARP